jgi:hypothetical protein
MGPWFNGRAAYNQSSVPGQLMNSIMVRCSGIVPVRSVLMSVEITWDGSECLAWKVQTTRRGVYPGTWIRMLFRSQDDQLFE